MQNAECGMDGKAAFATPSRPKAWDKTAQANGLGQEEGSSYNPFC